MLLLDIAAEQSIRAAKESSGHYFSASEPYQLKLIIANRAFSFSAFLLKSYFYTPPVLHL